MKKLFLFLLLSFCSMTVICTTNAPAKQNFGADEFELTVLPDTSKWALIWRHALGK